MWKTIRSFFSGCSCGCDPSNHKHVLVVDDGQSERTFYSATLKKAGYTVDTACCAKEALEVVQQKKPNVILMDFCMPDMNGNELCRQLKRSDDTAEIPVIFLTGSARSTDVMDCFDAGGEYFLTKPIQAKSLIRQVNTVLSDFEHRQACNQAK
jgi:CheY-like chemotaxis protein